MSLITCSKNCVHQENGYCRLEKAAAVTSTYDDCPHYTAKAKEHHSSAKSRQCSKL